MANSAVLQSGSQQPGWQVGRFIVSTALFGLAQLVGLGLIAWWVNRVERKAHGNIERDELLWKNQGHGVLRTLLSGRWPFTWAILILAAGNALTLAIGGAPWSITFAFNVWGAKALEVVGVNMSQFEFWQWDYPATALVPAAKLMKGSETMQRAYSRTRILVMLGFILALILVDHLNSPTFAFNSGQGNVEHLAPQHETDQPFAESMGISRITL